MASSTEKVSLIVVSWNGRPYLGACLASLRELDYPNYSVTVVDNASSDGSSQFVAESFPEVRLLQSPENLGFAGGANLGIKRTRGEIIALLNQDVTVRSDWLTHLVEALEGQERAAIVGGKLLYPDGRTIQHAGGILSYPQALANHHGYQQPDQGQYDQVQEVDYVTGAAMAMRRSVVRALGLFDAGFHPAYFEETDLCHRARQAGYKVLYIPKAVAIHQESASIGKDSYDYYLCYHTNRLRFVLKHYDAKQFLEDFVPAERRWLAGAGSPEEAKALRQAYQANLLRQPPLHGGRGFFRWAQEPEGRAKVGEALLSLRGSLPVTEAAAPQRQEAEVPSFEALITRLNTLWLIEERPFTSRTPVLGPLIVLFRNLWNWVSTKWYVRQILQQQIAFNSVVVQVINELARRREEDCRNLEATRSQLAATQSQLEDARESLAGSLRAAESSLANQIREAEDWLTRSDKVGTALTKQLSTIEHRITRLEDLQEASGEEPPGETSLL